MSADWRTKGRQANPAKRFGMSPGARYWPLVVHVDPPLLADGSVDVRTLLAGWDSDYNDRLIAPNPCSESGTFTQVNSSDPGAAVTARGPAAPTKEDAT